MVRRHSPYGGILHEVVEHNGTLYFGGIVADDLDQDMAGQARDALRQLDALLSANGSDRTSVLQVTAYLSDLREKPGFDEAWKEFFAPDHLPARAAMGIAELGSGVRLELVVIAAVLPRG